METIPSFPCSAADFKTARLTAVPITQPEREREREGERERERRQGERGKRARKKERESAGERERLLLPGAFIRPWGGEKKGALERKH